MSAPIVVPLSVWRMGKSRGEVKRFLASFSCLKQNKEVDEFLHLRAERFAKRNVSATHLVLSPDGKSILAYYTLVSKPLSLNAEALSEMIKGELSEFCRVNEKTGCYEFSAYLIAQLGRNFALGNECTISGDELMAGILMHLRQIRESLGGNIVFVDYQKGNNKLFNYYSRNGFAPMCAMADPSPNDDLAQMFRFLN